MKDVIEQKKVEMTIITSNNIIKTYNTSIEIYTCWSHSCFNYMKFELIHRDLPSNLDSGQ